MNKYSTMAIIFTVSSMLFVHVSDVRAESAVVHSGWKTEGDWREVAEGRSYWSGTYWGVSHNLNGEGMGHEMAWDCPASAQIADGMLSSKGFCTMVDPDGDKIFAEFAGDAILGERFKGHQDYTGGTGKYKGIEGGHGFNCLSIGTNQFTCLQEMEYTLP